MLFSERNILRITIITLLIFGIDASTKISKLQNELAEIDSEAKNYQAILKRAAAPTPTPPEIKDVLLVNYRDLPDASEETYSLDCNTSNISSVELSNITSIDGHKLANACKNTELNQWLLIYSSDENNFGYTQIIVIYDSSSKTSTRIYDSDPNYVECNNLIWQKNKWIYFTCTRFPTGIKGDFYRGGPFTYTYYLGNNALYTSEVCNKTHKETDIFEGAATGDVACTSLCDSDTECRADHFCDVTIGACIRRCTNNIECLRSPYAGECVAYTSPSEEKKIGYNSQRGDIVLGCSLKDMDYKY